MGDDRTRQSTNNTSSNQPRNLQVWIELAHAIIEGIVFGAIDRTIDAFMVVKF
jgi:hypothetical protein